MDNHESTEEDLGTNLRLLAQQFDLAYLPPDFSEYPYRYYAALQSYEPVKHLADGSVFLTRYNDLKRVYGDPQIFSSDKKVEFSPKYGNTPLYEHHTSSLVFSDAPLHTRVRHVLVQALSPRAIDMMLHGLQRSVSDLINTCRQKAQAGASVDLIDDFASAIPIEVIGNLLAIPAGDRLPLRGWSLAILGALEPALSADQLQRGNQAVTEFLDYLRMLVADRRRHPLDPEHDVLTRLMQAQGQGGISEIELLHNCIFLLNAGHETTTNLIGNGLEALWRFKDQRAKLTAQPALIKLAVEECLRFESSNQLGNRRATAAFTIDGESFAAGTRIHLCIGAANRDPTQFAQPDRFDIERQPNRHLAFGYGGHTCAGLNLARLEGQVAIAAWLKAFGDYNIVSDKTVRGGRVRFRGFERLPVVI
jgi:cytochrome P450